MKVFIDRDGCISCGVCIEVCPDVFEFADDGLAQISSQPTRSNIHKAHEAAEKSLHDMNCEEAEIFLEEFLSGFGLALDTVLEKTEEE